MNLSESEFFSLSSQMSDRDVTIASLKEQLRQKDNELLVTRSERDKWLMKYEQLKMQQEAVELENQLLRNYLWLSWEKIKAFVACVKDIRLLGFLQSFMQKTVSETCGVQALVHINEVVTLPEDDNKPNITNNFNAPVGQQVSHADYAGYPQTKEGEPYE